MKQNELELRLLMLYPPGRWSCEGSRGAPVQLAVPGTHYRALDVRPAGPYQQQILFLSSILIYIFFYHVFYLFFIYHLSL